MSYFQQFDYSFEHRPGKNHASADTIALYFYGQISCHTHWSYINNNWNDVVNGTILDTILH